MTLFGSLKRDIFALALVVSVVGMLGFDKALMPIFALAMIVVVAAIFTRNADKTRSNIIPGNVELGALTFVCGMQAVLVVISTSSVLADSLVRIVVAVALLYYAEAICSVTLKAISRAMDALNFPQERRNDGTFSAVYLLLMSLVFLDDALLFASLLCLAMYWTQRRAGQLTGWNDTTN